MGAPQNNFSSSNECCLPPLFDLFGINIPASFVEGLPLLMVFLLGLATNRRNAVLTVIIVLALITFVGSMGGWLLWSETQGGVGRISLEEVFVRGYGGAMTGLFLLGAILSGFARREPRLRVAPPSPHVVEPSSE